LRNNRPPRRGSSPHDLGAFREAIALIERVADGAARPEEEARVRKIILDCKETAVSDQDFEIAAYLRDLQDILRCDRFNVRNAKFHVFAARALCEAALAGHTALHREITERSREARAREAITERKKLYARYLADVFGPAPALTFSPAWRTDTAVLLARQMYEAREFGALPILADALQDAGCDDEQILGHCRGAGLHVRGCWVVDLVLGKE
jgi:hypothetical protein